MLWIRTFNFKIIVTYKVCNNQLDELLIEMKIYFLDGKVVSLTSSQVNIKQAIIIVPDAPGFAALGIGVLLIPPSVPSVGVPGWNLNPPVNKTYLYEWYLKEASYTDTLLACHAEWKDCVIMYACRRLAWRLKETVGWWGKHGGMHSQEGNFWKKPCRDM